MNKNILLVCMLFCSVLILSCGGRIENAGSTIYVDANAGISETEQDGSEFKPYDTIQEGLDAAGLGSSVRVEPAVYNEAGLEVPGSVQLIGMGTTLPTSPDTVIDGGGVTGAVVTLNGAASISNFKIQNGDYGIEMQYNLSNALANEITDTDIAAIYIHEDNNQTDHLVKGNKIDTNSGVGIRIDSAGTGYPFPEIEQNIVTNCGGYGVEIIGNARADLGQGVKASAGENYFTANTGYDVVNTNTSAVTKAENNYWDHATVAEVEANDINDSAYVDVDPLAP